MRLHDQIMNIQVRYSRGEFGKELHYLHYKEGHRDARHDAAEMSSIADELLEALEAVVSVSDRATVEFDLARAAIAKARGTP